MPIFTEKPVEIDAPVVDPIKVHIDPPTYDGITIDTNYTPSSALLQWAEGSNWTVDYYSQILGGSSEPTPLALNREPIYQQYRLIKNMVLKANGNWQTNQDRSTNVVTTTGDGWTFPFLTPNVGDMFVANIGDGTLGLWTITSATRKTILKDSVYEVEWILVGPLTPQRIQNLKEKTQITYYYSPASLAGGCGPFVTLEEKQRAEEYSAIYSELVTRYLTDFYSREHATFLIPDQAQKAYDHFVVKAMLRMISAQDDPRVRKVKTLNCDAAPVMQQPTIWDAVLRMDPARLYGSTERAHLVATRLLRGSPLLQAIGYTGIDRMAYPIDGPVDVDSRYDRKDVVTPAGLLYYEGMPRRQVGPIIPQALRGYAFFTPIGEEDETSEAWLRPADIHPVIIDDYYVFSSLFYDNAPGQSKLELLIRQLVQGEELNFKAFDHLLASVYDWDNLERFYYHPMVLALLRHVMR